MTTMRRRAERKVQDEIADDIFFVERMHDYEREVKGMLRLVGYAIVSGVLLGLALSVLGVL